MNEWECPFTVCYATNASSAGAPEGGVKTYRWNLGEFLVFVRARSARLARLKDFERLTIQAWIDDMATQDLSPNTLAPPCLNPLQLLRLVN